MRAYLIRHGPALPSDPRRWPEDADRPLSPDGVRKTRAAARAFARAVGPPPRLASSPARRAWSTARIWEEETGAPAKPERWDELGLGGSAREAFRRLERSAEASGDIALVGHAPSLLEVLGIALTGEPTPLAHLSRAGCAAIEFPRKVAPGTGRLEWLVTRKLWTRAAD